MAVEFANPLRDLVPAALVPRELDDVFAAASGGTGGVLGSLYYTDYAASLTPGGLSLVVELVIPGELALSLPGLDSLQLVLGGGTGGATVLTASLYLAPDDFELRLDDIPLALRFPPAILKPVAPAGGGPAPPHAQIETRGSVTLGRDWALRVEAGTLSLPECEIAGSGVTLSAKGVAWNFEPGGTLPQAIAAGLGGEFIGLAFEQTKLRLPAEVAGAPEFAFDYACIGTGGFTGGVSVDFQTPPTAEVAGFQVELERVGIRFQQSRLVAGEIEATLRDASGGPLPFFDTALAVDLKLQADRGLKVAIAAAPERQPAGGGTTVSAGLVTVRKPGIIAMTLNSVEITVEPGGGALRLGGTITPEVGFPGGEPLPAFGVEALTITSAGEVSVDGGWIDMPAATRLALGPFGLEITRAALGSEPDGQRWVGFSGALSLAAGVPITAAVDGLRIRWDQNGFQGIDLAGIALSLEIEGVLSFEGSVRFQSDPERFEGTGTLELTSLGLTVSAAVVIGKRADYTFLFFRLLVAPPVGVPIFNTGLAFYSLEALYARHMAPGKQPAERWYQDWYRRPQLGVTDPAKWVDERDSQAFGAGVTLGTLADKGYSVAVKGLLVLVVPGPVIMLDARANLLKNPAELAAPDAQALFTSLVVYDGRHGTIELAIEPHYVFPDAGELIDVTGIAEAFYSFNDPRAWHLYLGRREPAQRIRARLLSLFEANTYLMVEPDLFELGGFIGFDETYRAGPASLTLKAYIEGMAQVSLRPKQFKGTLHLHGEIAVAVFGIGLGLSASATLAAQAPQPFAVHADITVKVDLPWPFGDLEASLELDWAQPGPPRLTVPLQAAGLVHPLSTASWALDGTRPVVPIDARISLAFDRPVGDTVAVGANAQPAAPRALGDMLVSATLAAVELQVDDGPPGAPSFTTVATPAGGAATGPRKLYGMWQMQPGDSSQGNRRLMLSVRSPYEWLRPLTEPVIAQLEEAERFSPCEPMVETQVIVFDDEPNRSLAPAATISLAGVEWTAGADGARIVELAVLTAHARLMEPLPRPYHRALFLNDYPAFATAGGQTGTGTGSAPVAPPALRIDLPRDAKGISVLVASGGSWRLEAFNAAGGSLQSAQSVRTPVVGLVPSQLVLRARGIRRVEIRGDLLTAVLAVAIEGAPSATEVTTARTALEQSLERFKGEEPLFASDRTYRLIVRTKLTETEGRSLEGAEIEQPPEAQVSVAGAVCTIEQAFVFRTEGPPGRTSVTADRLHTLEPYVRQVQPPRGAAAVYRAYDIGAAFRADYVDQMYRASGRSLIISLRTDSGASVRVSNAMGKGNEVVLRREERAWLSTLRRSSCQLTVSESALARESVVRAQLPSAPLEPRRRFDAELVAEGPAGTEASPTLYGWSFVSSRYLDFADHFQLLGPVRAAPLAAGDVAAWRAVAQAAAGRPDPYTAAGAERERLRFADVDAFDVLFAPLLHERALPVGVELYAVMDDATTYGMLLEGPEPFDWERIVLACARSEPGASAEEFLDRAGRLLSEGGLLLADDGGRLLARAGDLIAEAAAQFAAAAPRAIAEGGRTLVLAARSLIEAGAVVFDGVDLAEAGRLLDAAGRVIAGTGTLGVDTGAPLIDGGTLIAATAERLAAVLDPTAMLLIAEGGRRLADAGSLIEGGTAGPAGVPIRVVRDGDGTRAFLLAPVAGGVGDLPTGEYTLTGTYRRASEGLPTLSRLGSTAPEVAVLAWRLPVG